MTTKSVTILGAGITGLWQAFLLGKQGYKVTLIDKSEFAFQHSSSKYAGAMLAPYCEEESSEQIVRILGIQSKKIWQTHYPNIVENGTIVLAQPREQQELVRFARMTQEYKTINSNQIINLEPDLGNRFGNGLFFENEAHMVPRNAMQFLLDEIKNIGVKCYFGTETKPANDGDWTIDCRGIGAQQDLINLRGVRGERIIIKSNDVKLNRPIRLLHPRFPIYIVPWPDGYYMIGATVIESDDQRNVTVRSALELLSTTYSLHPAFSESEIIEMGAGIRPAFPDNIPKIIRRGRKIYINGLYRHGFLLAPILADMVVKYLETGERNKEIFVEDTP